ncbi:hypothetical protein CDAR_414781 [Caerostris darwini]|uniref:Uncharacterized protein n=1 Tax=Caerostris darwini TaxID=1538125 RepID=A0AAV4RBQ7_9ARAC|nr:hypothetical protein CDAR_414781 [Caerostris darwini]
MNPWDMQPISISSNSHYGQPDKLGAFLTVITYWKCARLLQKGNRLLATDCPNLSKAPLEQRQQFSADPGPALSSGGHYLNVKGTRGCFKGGGMPAVPNCRWDWKSHLQEMVIESSRRLVEIVQSQRLVS